MSEPAHSRPMTDSRSPGDLSSHHPCITAVKSTVRLPVLAAALFSALLAGCVGIPEKTPEETVASRAQARLDALVAGDFDKAFKYASPAYRESSGIAGYTRRYAGVSTWNKATVSDVTCEEARCDVSVRVDYRSFKGGFENTRSLEERWIEIDGTWYIYLQ